MKVRRRRIQWRRVVIFRHWIEAPSLLSSLKLSRVKWSEGISRRRKVAWLTRVLDRLMSVWDRCSSFLSCPSNLMDQGEAITRLLLLSRRSGCLQLASAVGPTHPYKTSRQDKVQGKYTMFLSIVFMLRFLHPSCHLAFVHPQETAMPSKLPPPCGPRIYTWNAAICPYASNSHCCIQSEYSPKYSILTLKFKIYG